VDPPARRARRRRKDHTKHPHRAAEPYPSNAGPAPAYERLLFDIEQNRVCVRRPPKRQRLARARARASTWIPPAHCAEGKSETADAVELARASESALKAGRGSPETSGQPKRGRSPAESRPDARVLLSILRSRIAIPCQLFATSYRREATRLLVQRSLRFSRSGPS